MSQPADLLVGEARERQPQRMGPRERRVATALAAAFLVAAAAIAIELPWEPSAGPALIAALVLVYAVASRVEFEIGPAYAVPEQLVFVPILLLAPAPLVPLIVVAGLVLADLPEFLRGRKHSDRVLYCAGDASFTIAPVLVVSLLGPGSAGAGVLALAFAAQVAGGMAVLLVRESLGHGVPVKVALGVARWTYWIDACLTPLGFAVAIVVADQPALLAALLPLFWLLSVFSREREQRHAAALELNGAYRGTVMLLADVVQADDDYTGDHCRSVVELVNPVADELKVPESERQELEFAALLHDIGKIAIPNEIINKPAKLTEEEWELVKTHTIEGQLMLDRVGGLMARVGRIVRSCHERWDGGGYPDGLAGEEIPLASRIVFCCDAYNAMTTDRPYRSAMSPETALAELRGNAGTQFDARVVEAVGKVLTGESRLPAPLSAAAIRAVIVGGSAPAGLPQQA